MQPGCKANTDRAAQGLYSHKPSGLITVVRRPLLHTAAVLVIDRPQNPVGCASHLGITAWRIPMKHRGKQPASSKINLTSIHTGLSCAARTQHLPPHQPVQARDSHAHIFCTSTLHVCACVAKEYHACVCVSAVQHIRCGLGSWVEKGVKEGCAAGAGTNTQVLLTVIYVLYSMQHVIVLF